MVVAGIVKVGDEVKELFLAAELWKFVTSFNVNPRKESFAFCCDFLRGGCWVGGPFDVFNAIVLSHDVCLSSVCVWCVCPYLNVCRLLFAVYCLRINLQPSTANS